MRIFAKIHLQGLLRFLAPSHLLSAVFQVNATGCEGVTQIPLTCVLTASFTDQYCFYFPDTDADAIFDTLDECLLVEIGESTVVNSEVNTTVTFTCPEVPEAPPEPPAGFVRRLFYKMVRDHASAWSLISSMCYLIHLNNHLIFFPASVFFTSAACRAELTSMSPYP